LQVSKDVNKVLTKSNIARPIFHTHYANLATGEFGIADLIAKILSENGSVFKAGVESTPSKVQAIAGSMFTQEIINRVQAIFTGGTCRYPPKSVKAYLSCVRIHKGRFGKIQLSGVEDQPRPCPKPRCKYYLVQSEN
jgi:hypothetical protein